MLQTMPKRLSSTGANHIMKWYCPICEETIETKTEIYKVLHLLEHEVYLLDAIAGKMGV